jgi:HEAT repeat protein
MLISQIGALHVPGSSTELNLISYSIEQRMLHPPLHHTMTSADQPDDANALAQLRREFSSFNPTVRIAAIRRAVHFQEKAPRELLLETLRDRRIEMRTAAAETIEALKPWITDEQWLETLSAVSELYHTAL